MIKNWLIFTTYVFSFVFIFLDGSSVFAKHKISKHKECEKDSNDIYIVDDCGTISSQGIKFEFKHGYLDAGSGRYAHMHRLTWNLPKNKNVKNMTQNETEGDSCCSFEEIDHISDSPWSLISLNGDILRFTLEYESQPHDETKLKLFRLSHCWKLEKDYKTFTELPKCPFIKKAHKK